jgi:hypothetical protein
MKLGFTGTREGLTERQKERLRELMSFCLMTEEITEAHHGDCVGGDEQFHGLALELEIPKIVIHPPIDSKLRAWCSDDNDGAINVVLLPERPYLRRNRNIIRDTDRIIGCPKESIEPEVERGQGTWSTIRQARNRDKLLEIIWP